METFYLTVLIIAVCFLIIVLVWFGVLLSQGASSQTYPTNPAQCPDYWRFDGTNCVIPTTPSANIGNSNSIFTNDVSSPASLGNTYGVSGNKINFNDDGWSSNSADPICKKQAWANYYNILWSGVSNYNGCPST
jgi:hypothetical protein